MSKEVPYSYNPANYVRSGVNLSVFTWLFVLGLPALLLFLIYAKMDERNVQPGLRPGVQVEQTLKPAVDLERTMPIHAAESQQLQVQQAKPEHTPAAAKQANKPAPAQHELHGAKVQQSIPAKH